MKHALLCGWLFGFACWLAGIHWIYFSIHTFGGAPASLSLLITLLFAAALGLLQMLMAGAWYGLRTDNKYLDCLLLFPSCWLLFEWVKSWLLTGLPWLDIGVTALSSSMAGWLPLVGVLGTGALLTLMSSCLVLIEIPKVGGQSFRQVLALVFSKKYWLLLSPVLILLLGGATLKQIQWVQDSGQRIDVRVVQSHLNAFERWAADGSGLQRSFNEHMRGTEADERLILWSETSLPVRDSQPNIAVWLKKMEQQFASRGQTLAAGILHEQDGKIYNAVRLIGLDQGYYLKSRLVPFGEFTPALFKPLSRFFSFPESALHPAAPPNQLLTVGDIPLAIAICYEIAYAQQVLPQAAKAGLILTTSNDSWFGRSIGPWQHLQIAQARAAESRRWVLRSTNGGIGAAIDEQGRIVQQLKPFEADALSAHAPVLTGTTPATQIPRWLYAVLALAVIAGLQLGRRLLCRSSNDGQR